VDSIVYFSFYHNKKEKEVSFIVDKWLGKKIVLPSGNIKNKKSLKLVTYIDGNCGVCISELDKWRSILIELKRTNKLEFFFYLNSFDFDSLIKSINKENVFPIILINDENNDFFTQNKLENNKLFQTFLLDEYNNVIVIGNPIYNKKILELYLEYVDKISD